jgi:hypothetical protein
MRTAARMGAATQGTESGCRTGGAFAPPATANLFREAFEFEQQHNRVDPSGAGSSLETASYSGPSTRSTRITLRPCAARRAALPARSPAPVSLRQACLDALPPLPWSQQRVGLEWPSFSRAACCEASRPYSSTKR